MTDFPQHGGLPEPAPADDTVVRETRPRRGRGSDAQIGIRLSIEQAEELEEAAEMFGVARTTLARMLIVRGAREIVERARG